MAIKIGDKVNVYFEYTPCIFNATVEYIPQALGDSYLLTLSDERSCSVQLYSKIEQVNDINDNKNFVK